LRLDPDHEKDAAWLPVTTERKDHLQYLVGELRGFVRHIVVLQGGMSGQERRRSLDQLASIPDSTERLILATGRYIGEGFDDARLDTLFLACRSPGGAR
jgi:superfamily II DNA/RNA helicase